MFFYLVGPFLRHVPKGMWGCDCWLLGQSLVCHFFVNSTLALLSTLIVFWMFCTSAINVGYQLLVCIAVRRRPFSRAPRVSTNLSISSRPRHAWSASAATFYHPDQVSVCGQHASRARLTTWLATMHAGRCFFESTFRQPRANPHDLAHGSTSLSNARCLRIAASLL